MKSTLKITPAYLLSILSWALFTFSILRLAETFSADFWILVLIFNIFSAGYIFHSSFQFERYPSASAYGVSMILFHVLVWIFHFLYGFFFLLREIRFLPYLTVLNLVSNAFAAPIFYLVLHRITRVRSPKKA